MTTAQNHTHYYPGATYMHALTLATEAYISQFSKKEIQASAVQIIMQLNQAMAIAIENAGLAEAMLEKAVEQAEQLSERGYGGYAQAIVMPFISVISSQREWQKQSFCRRY